MGEKQYILNSGTKPFADHDYDTTTADKIKRATNLAGSVTPKNLKYNRLFAYLSDYFHRCWQLPYLNVILLLNEGI